MLHQLSIAQLYPYALAEGEGVGTAYEYLVKRLVLSRWLADGFTPKRVVIAGLPQQYGSSLDFALMAHEFGAELTVIDDRPEALNKFARSLSQAQLMGNLSRLSWSPLPVKDLTAAILESDGHDLALSSEVIQRLGASDQRSYFKAFRHSATRAALFCPNAGNRSHADLSGLAGLTLDELRGLAAGQPYFTGLIDMPPFPPGITRTDQQREQASTGRMEAMAMAALSVYARLERFLPDQIRNRQSHIVFALSEVA